MASLGFGAGFARGLSGAYTSERTKEEDLRKEKRAEKLREFSLLMPKVMESAELTGDWAAAEDFIGQYFPTTAAETTARRAAKKAKQPKMSPPTLAPAITPETTGVPAAAASTTITPPAGPVAPPATGTTDIAAMGAQPAAATAAVPAGGAPALLAGRPAVSPGTPAATPSPQQDFFGITMPTPAQQRQMKVDADMAELEQTRLAQAALARRIWPSLQKDDPSITLEDAMRYVTKGDLMSNASQRAASMYRYGVDREALSKELFGKPFDQLDQAQASIVMREEKSMLEQEAFARGTGTGQAAFQKPADLKTAQDVGVQVGTSAADVAGQVVPTEQQRDRRASVEELQTALTHIRDNLLVALPSKNELSGLAPGAAYAVRRRHPDYREKIAALESAVNNIVNVMARSVGQQRGTQTERDALRAEAAILQMRDAFLTGDTRESATVRINESLRTLENILGRLPTVPVAADKPTKTAPGGGTPAASATAGGAGSSSTAVKKGNAWVIELPGAATPPPAR